MQVAGVCLGAEAPGEEAAELLLQTGNIETSCVSQLVLADRRSHSGTLLSWQPQVSTVFSADFHLQSLLLMHFAV